MKGMGKMFSFITETWNPVAGACPFECSYCWARSLINRYNFAKYRGLPRLDEVVMKKIPKEGFVFVQDMSDISALRLEDADYLISKIAEYEGKADYLFLTKNPQWYVMLSQHGIEYPSNLVLGATIETNRDISISKAPYPYDRFNALNWINNNLVNTRTFISIEPIMEFDRDELLPVLNLLRPSEGIAIGLNNYDTKDSHLPEPTLDKTLELISSLEKRGIKVFRKTIRKAWNE